MTGSHLHNACLIVDIVPRSRVRRVILVVRQQAACAVLCSDVVVVTKTTLFVSRQSMCHVFTTSVPSLSWQKHRRIPRELLCTRKRHAFFVSFLTWVLLVPYESDSLPWQLHVRHSLHTTVNVELVSFLRSIGADCKEHASLL